MDASPALKVWITRPTAHEILMGGERELQMWLTRPHYSHCSFDACLSDPSGAPRYHDTGWRSEGADNGVRVKPLLKQHDALRKAVWDEVFLSVCPVGMSYAEGVAWHNTQRGEESFDGYPITLWHNLTDDRAWEGKCNTAAKRFLLEVDLFNATVKRVRPLVMLRRAPDAPVPALVATDAITPELAAEYWHPAPDAELVPF